MNNTQVRNIVVRRGMVHYTEVYGILRDLIRLFLLRGCLWVLRIPNPKSYRLGAESDTERLILDLVRDAELKRLFAEQAAKIDG